MRSIRTIFVVLALAIFPVAGFAAVPAEGEAVVAHAEAAGHTEHGLTARAVELWRPFGFPITNSMLVTWIVAAGLIVFAQLATRRMKEIPEGAQNFWEWMVESLHDFLEGIIGHHLVQRTFWFFATIFIFILFSNWIGLLPFFGSVGWGHQTPEG